VLANELAQAGVCGRTRSDRLITGVFIAPNLASGDLAASDPGTVRGEHGAPDESVHCHRALFSVAPAPCVNAD